MEDIPFGSDCSVRNIRVATVEGGEAGVLVLKSNLLVAILTQIDEEVYATKGKWFLETGFGRLSGQHRNFHSLKEAVDWIADAGDMPQRLAAMR